MKTIGYKYNRHSQSNTFAIEKIEKKYEIGKLWVVDDFGDKILATDWLKKHKRKL